MAQVQNNNRDTVDTFTDSGNFQTGYDRRLRVTADPLNIPVAANVSSVSQLAAALGTIKPQLMDYAIDKQTDANVLEINKGKTAAQTGGAATGEMQQYGFDKVKSVNDWTDWQAQVTQEYNQNFDKDNGDLDAFLKTQWESHPFSDKSSTYVDNFTTLAGKTMDKVREAQGIFQADKQNAQNDVDLTRLFVHDIKDVMGAGKDYTTAAYEARREDLRGMFPGKTNSQLDELAHNAILQQAQDSGDTSLFNIFKSAHADGTPGLYEIPKWKAKIDEEIHQILERKNSSRSADEAHNSKILKEAADTTERDLLFGLIAANGLDDPTDKDKAITAVVAKAKAASDSGLPISDATIKTLLTASTGIDKKEETAYQNQNYNTLRLGNASTQQIAKAVNNHDISQGGFEKLMNARDAQVRRDASTTAKGEKPLIQNPYFKDARRQIMVNAGYSFGSFDSNNQQAKNNGEAVMAIVQPYIEDLVDKGMSPKDASAKGTELGIKQLHDANIQNKGLDKAGEKLDKVKHKQADPVAYYNENPQDYITDSKAKTVPVMDAKSLLNIQRKALAIAKTKQLKTHESTH